MSDRAARRRAARAERKPVGATIARAPRRDREPTDADWDRLVEAFDQAHAEGCPDCGSAWRVHPDLFEQSYGNAGETWVMLDAQCTACFEAEGDGTATWADFPKDHPLSDGGWKHFEQRLGPAEGASSWS